MLAFLGQWIGFVALNGLVVFITIFLMRYVIGYAQRISDILLDGVSCFLGVVVFLLTSLGVLGVLNLVTILSVLVLVALPMCVYMYRDQKKFHLSWKVLRFRQRLPDWTTSYEVYLTLFLLLFGGMALVVAALLEPSTMVDTLTYHLPMPVSWWRAERLTVFYLPFSDYSNSYFPGNGELLYFWALLPFRDEFLVRMVSCVMWLVLGLSLYNLFSRAGGSRRIGLMSAILLLFTPLVQSQSTDLFLDMISAAVFSLSLTYVMRLQHDECTLRNVLMLAMTSGVFMGIKYSGPAYVLLLFLGLVWMLFVPRHVTSIPRRKKVLYLGLWWGGVAVFGGYWYLRNLVLTGNPLFPLGIGVGDFTIFHGCSAGLSKNSYYGMRMLVNHLSDISIWVLIRSLAIGYGVAYWAIILLSLGTLVFGVWSRIKGQMAQFTLPTPQGQTFFLVGLMLAASLTLYIRTPYSVMRFSHDNSPATVVELVAGMRFSLISGILILYSVLWGARFSTNFSRVSVLSLTLLSFLQGVLAGLDGFRANFFGSRVFTLPRLLLVFFLCLFLVGVVSYLRNRYPTVVFRKVGKLLSKNLPFAVALVSLLSLVASGAALYALFQYRDHLTYKIYIAEYGPLAEGWQWVARHITDSKIALVGFL